MPQFETEILRLDPSFPNESPPVLRNGDVVVICGPVDLACRLPMVWLDERERRRLAEYRQAADRRRHHAAHTLKRWAIGGCLARPPQDLVFDIDPGGKPRLDPHSLFFNLSHSGGWVALALSRDGEVGVDVELGEGLSDEQSWPPIRHSDDPELSSRVALLAAWTLKEAAAKCCGEGLVLDPAKIRLSSIGEGPIVCSDGCRRWHAARAMIDAHAHIAVASLQMWSRLRMVRLVTPPKDSDRGFLRPDSGRRSPSL